MNIAKHMEAIFLAVVAVIGATTFATAGTPLQRSAPSVAAATEAAMPVVVVSARRLSAAEKAQLPQ
ncbi:hypothetical protein [Massilia scottii]|uniref:hypothetical protein n=1 Tax=Massilia scottii TaxID=3057166 RepID=UPI0027967365|nr:MULTISPECIES: hypothetical protein [unclassified Massilia]MDQ1814292.1 hypothetical protein [Massilia sp. CCM 9210]MDQ1831173.1 hypothetical protein [Massilia sp. CCM 9029]